MRKLKVFIEINGKQVLVGCIKGDDSNNARFRYDIDYLNLNTSKAISINLPLQEAAFDVSTTRTFFEGLLPEGFTRKSVASYLHLDEKDYISILAKLGRECLGAIKIMEEEQSSSNGYDLLTPVQVHELAEEGMSKSVDLVTRAHLSLTGASGKVGLYYESQNGAWYLPKGDAPSTHIVKLSHVRLDKLVINEQLCLMTAKKLGIETIDSFIINTGNYEDSDVLFAAERYDRVLSDKAKIDGLKVPYRLHQEDFAQALGIESSKKYEPYGDNYLRKMFSLIKSRTKNPLVEQKKLWDMIIYDYLIGNTDNHIKNFSLLYDSNLQGLHLSPAYDIVSTKIYRSSTKELSFHIGNAYTSDAVTKKDFEIAARENGIGLGIAMDRFDEIKEGFSDALKESVEELVSDGYVSAVEIAERIKHSS